MNKVPFKCVVCGNDGYESIGHSSRESTKGIIGTFRAVNLFACTRCTNVFTDPKKFSSTSDIMPFLSDQEELKRDLELVDKTDEEIQEARKSGEEIVSLRPLRAEYPMRHDGYFGDQ
ncbi:MAG: hypothetical protein Q8Q90_00625 [bacterium]|nr:hypothetical protein [bacterium]